MTSSSIDLDWIKQDELDRYTKKFKEICCEIGGGKIFLESCLWGVARANDGSLDVMFSYYFVDTRYPKGPYHYQADYFSPSHHPCYILSDKYTRFAVGKAESDIGLQFKDRAFEYYPKLKEVINDRIK